VAARLHRLEFTVAAEDITVFIAKGLHDAEGGNLRGRKVCAHRIGNARSLGGCTMDSKPL
jgi:hypothetical protein